MHLFPHKSSLSYLLVFILLLCFPLVASDFFVFQIGAYALILGLLALSLMLLAGYGGMVSLAQISVAGLAGYLVAILGENSVGVLGLGWPTPFVLMVAISAGALMSALIGIIAVRTEGIYTIMITLAIAVCFFYFTRQNYSIFNGFTGFSGVKPPEFMSIYWRDPVPFYYLTLVAAAGFFAASIYGSRSTFGLSLQAVRDNPERMRSLGYNVNLHRIFAFLLSGIIAAVAGILLVWFNGRISSGTVGVDIAIDILVIAVIGGLRHPIGAFIGALLFVLLENFAIDLIDRERFNTVIGVVFILIVYFSPDGILGFFEKLKSLGADRKTTSSKLVVDEK